MQSTGTDRKRSGQIGVIYTHICFYERPCDKREN